MWKNVFRISEINNNIVRISLGVVLSRNEESSLGVFRVDQSDRNLLGVNVETLLVLKPEDNV